MCWAQLNPVFFSRGVISHQSHPPGYVPEAVIGVIWLKISFTAFFNWFQEEGSVKFETRLKRTLKPLWNRFWNRPIWILFFWNNERNAQLRETGTFSEFYMPWNLNTLTPNSSIFSKSHKNPIISLKFFHGKCFEEKNSEIPYI